MRFEAFRSRLSAIASRITNYFFKDEWCRETMSRLIAHVGAVVIVSAVSVTITVFTNSYVTPTIFSMLDIA